MDDRSQGLLLQSFPYLGSHRILKVLAPTGMITFIAKNVSSPKSRLAAVITPFLLAEWVYVKDAKEIHPLKDGTLLEDFGALKQNYETVSAAGQIAKDLLATQLPSKPAEPLFQLALAYFRKLPLFPNPNTLAASFRTKLLSHEGLIHLEERCAQCGEPTTHLSRGESVCPRHAPQGSIQLFAKEREILQRLLSGRSFSELAEIPLEAGLSRKINTLFENF